MNPTKKQRLEAKGWRVGTAEEFLELTPEESLLVRTILLIRRMFTWFHI